MSVFATKGTQRPRVLATELSYQIQVNGIMLETTRPLGSRKDGMFTPAEMKELREAYRTGVSEEEFAGRIQERDRLVGKALIGEGLLS